MKHPAFGGSSRPGARFQENGSGDRRRQWSEGYARLEVRPPSPVFVASRGIEACSGGIFSLGRLWEPAWSDGKGPGRGGAPQALGGLDPAPSWSSGNARGPDQPSSRVVSGKPASVPGIGLPVCRRGSASVGPANWFRRWRFLSGFSLVLAPGVVSLAMAEGVPEDVALRRAGAGSSPCQNKARRQCFSEERVSVFGSHLSRLLQGLAMVRGGLIPFECGPDSI